MQKKRREISLNTWFQVYTVLRNDRFLIQAYSSNGTSSSMVTKPVPAVKLPLCRRIKTAGEGKSYILQVSFASVRKLLLTGIKSDIHLASPRQTYNSS